MNTLSKKKKKRKENTQQALTVGFPHLRSYIRTAARASCPSESSAHTQTPNTHLQILLRQRCAGATAQRVPRSCLLRSPDATSPLISFISSPFPSQPFTFPFLIPSTPLQSYASRQGCKGFEFLSPFICPPPPLSREKAELWSRSLLRLGCSNMGVHWYSCGVNDLVPLVRTSSGVSGFLCATKAAARRCKNKKWLEEVARDIPRRQRLPSQENKATLNNNNNNNNNKTNNNNDKK